MRVRRERGAGGGVGHGIAGGQDQARGDLRPAGHERTQQQLPGHEGKVQIANDEINAAVARVVARQKYCHRRLAISGFGNSPVLTLEPPLQRETDARLVVND